MLSVKDVGSRRSPALPRRLRNLQGATPDEAEQRFIDKVFEDDRVEGWKNIAHFVGREESVVRAAYRSDPHVRCAIFKTGGRYWSTPGELMNLVALFFERRATARAIHAGLQRRTENGRFAE